MKSCSVSVSPQFAAHPSHISWRRFSKLDLEFNQWPLQVASPTSQFQFNPTSVSKFNTAQWTPSPKQPASQTLSPDFPTKTKQNSKSSSETKARKAPFNNVRPSHSPKNLYHTSMKYPYPTLNPTRHSAPQSPSPSWANQANSGVSLAIHNLTDVCFKKCITTKISAGKLDKYEEPCMQNCVDRFLDANKLILSQLDSMRGA